MSSDEIVYPLIGVDLEGNVQPLACDAHGHVILSEADVERIAKAVGDRPAVILGLRPDANYDRLRIRAGGCVLLADEDMERIAAAVLLAFKADRGRGSGS